MLITLSICIPTFNRPEPLKTLNDDFLSKVLDCYPDDVEVLVCDDSVQSDAQSNQASLDPRIQYMHNPVRTGFAKSLDRCFQQANGKFVWLLSDDDPIEWEGFVRLLEELCKDEADCYLVPVQWKSYFNEHRVDRLDFLKQNQTYTVAEMFERAPDFLPFVLLSAGVVRLDKSGLHHASEALGGNLFIHIAMYMDMLHHASRVRALPLPVVDYQLTRTYQYDPISLFDMRLAVLRYLSPKYDSLSRLMPVQIHAALQSSLNLQVESDIGIVKMKPLKGAHATMRRYFWKYRAKPNYAAMLILLFPPVLSRLWYYLFCSLRYAREHGHQTGWRNQLRLMRHAYQKLRDFAVFNSDAG